MVITDEQLIELIARSGIAPPDKLKEVYSHVKSAGTSLLDTLVDQNIIADEQLGQLIANQLHVPFISLTQVAIQDDVLRIVPEKIARSEKILPFEVTSNILKLAMADPSNQELVEYLRKKTGLQIAVYYATPKDIYAAMSLYRREMQKIFDNLINISGDQTKTPFDPPIEKIVKMIITYAYNDKASDIHIEAQEKDSLVRYRIDGVLHDVIVLPKSLIDQIVSRIKVISNLRTDEHLTPQDGKMRLLLDEEDLDIRVSVVPVADGEKVVLRLLASKYRQFSLLDLGMSESDLKKVENAFNRSFGMVLSTGPTGSGKTTTIYSILKILNTREKNITTIEDPIEYRIKGVNQIQVNPKTNLTFATGLRSILRQDPNIIFVGEIRDNETAGIAVNAALTGHLVFSTLHTNDAATALPRFTDMEVEPFLVASTVNIIIAQRLIRRICDICKESYLLNREEVERNIPDAPVSKIFGESNQLNLFRGRGCKVCHQTGYSGRIGIFEVLEVTNTIKQLIAEKKDSSVIEKQAAAEGMSTMLDEGLKKAKAGLTTIEEVIRVTKFE